MTVVQDPGGFHDDGERDARRHHERVRRQIAEALRERIGEERIITAGPEHRVRVPITGEREYRFIFDRGAQGGVGQGGGEPGEVLAGPGDDGDAAGSGPGAGDGDGAVTYEVWLDRDEVEALLFEQLGLPRMRRRASPELETTSIAWNDIARRGALLDKKATILENMRRNAASGEARIGGIDRDDLRYRTYTEELRPKTRCVVFFMLDASGSMGAFEKRCARLFFWWAYRFLRSRYANVELVFLAHTTTAVECDEDEFFTRVESGGTRVSSAWELALELRRRRYPADEHDVVYIHASDGDNMPDDNERSVALVCEACADAILAGYVQIARAQVAATWSHRTLYSRLRGVAPERLATALVTDEREIWAALRTVFRPAPDELEDVA